LRTGEDSSRQWRKEIADRVLWREDGQFRELAAMASGPVCEMAVDTSDAIPTNHNGAMHWFCSASGHG
jgi:putative ABC transport system ATP-binding protein